MRRSWIRILVLLSLFMLLTPLTAGTAGAETVGASTVAYQAEWAPDPTSTAAGTADQVTLTHQTLADTSYSYIESAWVKGQVPDNEAVMESFVTAVLSQVGIVPSAPVLAGNLADGTLWRLYVGPVSGQDYGMLFTVDTADPSRMNVDSLLIGPAATFPQALDAVQRAITVNGTSPLAGIDLARVTTALQGGQPGTTPAIGTTPAGGLTLPPLGGTTTPVAGTTPIATAGGQSVTVAGATITYNDRWIFDSVNSAADAETFWDAAGGSGNWYGYLPQAPTSGDAAAQLAEFNSSYFPGTFDDIQQVALEPISPTSAWSLTTAAYGGAPREVITYVDTSVSGQRRVQMLMSNAGSGQASLADVQQSIQIDGVGAFNGVDPARIGSLLAGAPAGQTPAVAATAPVASQQVVPTPSATSAAQQGGALTQTATVGQDTVAYASDWQYDATNSSADIATFQQATNPSVIYVYGQSADRMSGGNPMVALQILDVPTSFSAQDAQLVSTTVLPSGRAWELYTWQRDGAAEVALIVVDVTSTPGTLFIQMLLASPDQFATALPSAQQSFQINGQGALAELDPAQVSALLAGSAPPAQTPATGQTTPAQTPQASGGSTDYAAQDAPTGCDRIGWVVTDPAQLPATQADLDHRGSCVGGATYVASCGSYVVSDAGTEVQCTVNVSVGAAPMAVTSQQFSLVDAAGNRYPVDQETTVMLVMLLGAPELPEATVDAGTITSGTVMFNVPSTASLPWVLEVAPDTIASTGEQPGILVIEGPLQDVKVFGG